MDGNVKKLRQAYKLIDDVVADQDKRDHYINNMLYFIQQSLNDATYALMDKNDDQ